MEFNDIRDLDYTEAAWESLYDAVDATQFLNQDAHLIYDSLKHRLKLRQDNADLRLTPLAASIGLVSEEQGSAASARQAAIDAGIERAYQQRVDGVSLELWLRRPGNDWHELPEPLRSQYPDELWEPIATEIAYSGHIDRMRTAAARLQRQEDKKIPADIDYSAIPAMKTEARQRLDRVRPGTIGQAARIPGITPADIALLLVWIQKH